MKKSLLLSAVIAGMLAVAHPAPAQTVLMSQDFNGSWSTTNPPPGWRIYWDEGDTSTNDWHRAPDLGVNPWPDNPTPYALLDSAPGEFGEDSLVSPLVNCSGCNSISLRCSTFFKGTLRLYHAQLLGAVDGGDFEYVVFDYNGMNIGPVLQDFNLSWAVGHNQVQVAWVFSGPTDGISHWAIDDVSIIGDTVTDNVGCVAVLAPVDTVDSNFTVTPQAIFKNYSPGPVTFPVKMTIGFGYIATDTVRDLAPGESTTVNFAPWSAAPRGIVLVSAMTTLRGDIEPSNDTVDTFVTVRVRDVGCIAITAPRDTVDSGASVQPMARIRNSGTDTATFYAIFTIGAWTDSALVDDIVPGDERDVSFGNWQANASFWTTARCSTNWSMDPYARNDTASRRFFVRPPHFKDLAAVQILEPSAIVGENAQVTPSGSIRSYCDDPQTVTAYFTIVNGSVAVYAESASQSIQPGESLVVDFPAWTASPIGTYTDTLRVRLDGDADPANDMVSSQFEVQSAFHDVGVTAILSPLDTVLEGSVAPNAVVRNYGMFQENFFVKCRILRGVTPVYFDSAGVSALNPGETTVVVLPAWNATEGHYTVRCSCDVPGDANPSNDWMEKSFVVVKPQIPPGWLEVASVPLLPSSKDIKDGGWLARDPGLQLIFAAKGNKLTDFYAYSQLGDSWTSLAAYPLGSENKPPSKGACACTDGNGTLYATKGNGQLGFHKYSFSENTWQQLKDIPLGISGKKVKGGTSAAYVYSGGQPWVYLLKGIKNEFYRYDTYGDSWQTLDPAPVGINPKWDKGSWVVYDGVSRLYAHKAKYHEFFSFNTETNTWSPDSLLAMPKLNANGKSKKCGDGGCAAWYDGTITALKGGNTQELWHYTVSTNSWTELDTMPTNGSSNKKKKVKAGGSIVAAGSNVFFAIKGNKTCEFWRFHLVGGVGVREDVAPVTLPAGGEGLSVAPNPATGFATLRLPSLFAASSIIRIYDIRGSLVMERPAAASQLRLDCRDLVPGVYLVQARNPGGTATCRLVKE
jgi:hypothetical protein